MAFLYSPAYSQQKVNQKFKERWLERFGLTPKNWRGNVRKHLRSLPFADECGCRILLVALFEKVPGMLGEQPDSDTARLAEAFGWCCFSFWQCGSSFPAYPEDYATFLLSELLKPTPRRSAQAGLLTNMIVGAGADAGRCGFNALKVRDPEPIRESERSVLCGDYDAYLKASEKYHEYLARLGSNPEFQQDWRALKRAFPRKTAGGRILHRSLIPERNWYQAGAVAFITPAARFQAAFDLFCWKYFLWGMKKNTPLLLKPSVVFTPLGTQIFIPGYLSFDPKRDLDLRRISRLHKARGTLRQGSKLSPGREDLTLRARRARRLDREAKSRGLKGDSRYNFIAGGLGLPEPVDFRQVRFLLTKL